MKLAQTLSASPSDRNCLVVQGSKVVISRMEVEVLARVRWHYRHCHLEEEEIRWAAVQTAEEERRMAVALAHAASDLAEGSSSAGCPWAVARSAAALRAVSSCRCLTVLEGSCGPWLGGGAIVCVSM